MFDLNKLRKILESKISKCDRVVIIPHNNADFDAIGSAIGLSLIAKEHNKPYTIIVNDPPHIIESGVKKIIDECKDNYEILKKDKFLKNQENVSNTLFILTDVNKINLICASDILPDKDNVIVIDHHNSDKNTVESNHIFIDCEKSSASEIITELLQNMNINIPSDAANYLYAGIYLDTAKLTKNCKANTMNMAAKLLEAGADISKVNEYFREDYRSDRRVQSLISNIKITNCMVALIKAGEDEEYTREELAKAADYALKFGVDAAFSIGKIADNVVSISGRAVDKVNVGMIMETVATNGMGGGNPYSGAAKLTDQTIEDAYNKLVDTLKPVYYVKKIIK